MSYDKWKSPFLNSALEKGVVINLKVINERFNYSSNYRTPRGNTSKTTPKRERADAGSRSFERVFRSTRVVTWPQIECPPFERVVIGGAQAERGTGIKGVGPSKKPVDSSNIILFFFFFCTYWLQQSFTVPNKIKIITVYQNV